MFEWIDRDFFWINNKPPIFNVNHITRFFVYENETKNWHFFGECESAYNSYYINKQYCPSFTINGNDIHTIKCETMAEAEEMLVHFMKNRPITNNLPENKNYGKVDNKILLD